LRKPWGLSLALIIQKGFGGRWNDVRWLLAGVPQLGLLCFGGGGYSTQHRGLKATGVFFFFAGAFGEIVAIITLYVTCVLVSSLFCNYV